MVEICVLVCGFMSMVMLSGWFFSVWVRSGLIFRLIFVFVFVFMVVDWIRLLDRLFFV